MKRVETRAQRTREGAGPVLDGAPLPNRGDPLQRDNNGKGVFNADDYQLLESSSFLKRFIMKM